MCRAGHAEHVVDAHQRIGDDDGLHGRPERRHADAGMLVAIMRIGQQLVGDPQQTQATDQHQAGNAQQPDHADGHHGAHDDGAHSAPDDGFLLQFRWQAARCKCDDDRVVAGQHQIDQDDGKQGIHPLRGKQFHEQNTPNRFDLSRSGKVVAVGSGPDVFRKFKTLRPNRMRVQIEGLARQGA